jgi:Mg-chelatase subunit ChlI
VSHQHTTQKNEVIAGKLLSLQEREACVQITLTESPYNQRAQALLALDDGSTRADAAYRSGLSAGQVKYLLSRFREKRMAMFPEVLPEQKLPNLDEVDDGTETINPDMQQAEKTTEKKHKGLKKSKKKKKKSKKSKDGKKKEKEAALTGKKAKKKNKRKVGSA